MQIDVRIKKIKMKIENKKSQRGEERRPWARVTNRVTRFLFLKFLRRLKTSFYKAYRLHNFDETSAKEKKNASVYWRMNKITVKRKKKEGAKWNEEEKGSRNITTYKIVYKLSWIERNTSLSTCFASIVNTFVRYYVQ